MIIEAGVDMEHKDRDNCNALWMACMRTDNIKVYKALVKGGCDPVNKSENII